MLRIRDMLFTSGSRGKSGGAVLSSSLDQGREYAARTRRLGEERLIGCRAVLILTALLTLFMPLTEHLYGWDKFMQGGPDVEFGTLGLLLFAGLVLLMAYRAVTAPFLTLLAYRLIALPLRCLRMFGHLSLAWSFLIARIRQGTPLAFSPLAAIRLRI
ncbi:MAG TPA: hypothetical protein VH139_01020 [Acidobacteriaceae bacterium]|nr:hypothetical protein [Acidobacteriaceae bacterium]